MPFLSKAFQIFRLLRNASIMNNAARDFILYLVLLLLLCPSVSSSVRRVVVSNGSELQKLFIAPVDSLEVQLLPGSYQLVPSYFADSTCGNCEDPNTLVNATVGLHIRGSWVRIHGPEDRSAIINTHSGYGLLFDGCRGAVVENVSLTGGVRDPDGNATNAAIVVKNSAVRIQSNRIFDNLGDSATVMKNVVGIMGICGRENSLLIVRGNEIIRNSWDGIALYRGASAIIEQNFIDGVDKARGSVIGGGRGVAIGVTWDAKATITANLVRRYWKGIGLFVDAVGEVKGNIVEDVLTWGITLWDADKGKPVGIIEDNIIYKTGACGAAITRSAEGESPGKFVGNIIVETAQNPAYDSPDYYCYQCALSVQAVPSTFLIHGNVFHNNRRAMEDLPDYDIPRASFLEQIREACTRISASSVLRRSQFATDYCQIQ